MTMPTREDLLRRWMAGAELMERQKSAASGDYFDGHRRCALGCVAKAAGFDAQDGGDPCVTGLGPGYGNNIARFNDAHADDPRAIAAFMREFATKRWGQP